MYVLTLRWLYSGSVFGEFGSGRPSASHNRFVESGSDEETEKIGLTHIDPLNDRLLLVSNSQRVNLRAMSFRYDTL